MSAYITAIATSVPEFELPQNEVVDFMITNMSSSDTEERVIKKIFGSASIDKRYSIISDYGGNTSNFFTNDVFPSTSKRMELYQKNAFKISKTAILECLKKAKLKRSEITHLIVVSCTGMYAPGLDIEIIQNLNFDKKIKRTLINFMGCYGSFNALRIAKSICSEDLDANVLIVSIELCTLHFQKEYSVDNILSNSIFADGCAAALVQGKKGDTDISLEITETFCELIFEGFNDMAWSIGDTGFNMVLTSYIPKLIADNCNNFLEGLAISQKSIDIYAVHPGGKRILEVIEKAFNITTDDLKYSYDVLKNFGNMSSATILFVLKEILSVLSKKDIGKSVYACGFGPGLTYESALLKAI